MNTLKHWSILLISALIISCNKDTKKTEPSVHGHEPSEVDGLLKIQELSDEHYTVELYSINGIFIQGYNDIFLRIKKNNTSDYYTGEDAITWSPLMKMGNMEHSCPQSAPIKIPQKQSLWNGYVVFTMPSEENMSWNLTVHYSINGTSGSVSGEIKVHAQTRQKVASFTGTDGKNYVLAYIAPQKPKNGLNDMTVGLFEMETMFSFPIAKDYTIQIDPRMPSMGNHGSPNNVHLTQQSDGFYHGKLALTMSGYWKINLQLLNVQGFVLKGEEVTDDHPSSSLYLEVEF